MNYIGLIIGIILLNNYVIERMLGINTFIVGPKSFLSSFYMGLSISCALFMSMLIVYPIYSAFILPLGLWYLDLLIITFITVLILTTVNRLIKEHLRSIYHKIGIYFPILIFNSGVFGALFSMDVKYVYDYPSALIYALACGLGYTLALIFVNMIKNSIDETKLPEVFKGIPITLIVTGIVSMIFQFLGSIIELV